MKKNLCRLLVILMAWTPFQSVNAEMIGAERISSTIERADVVRALESFGVDPAAASARVAALTDDEMRSLASHIDEAAAGSGPAAVFGWIALAFVIYWFVWRRSK